MSEMPPIRPGMIVGILGGGQLGRMLASAAAEMGLSCHIYSPDRQSPAFAVAAARTIAPYNDQGALSAFADATDVVTFEFENVPVSALKFLAERVPVFPGPRSLEVSQDRLLEKELIAGLGIPVASFADVNKQSDIYSALAKTGRPAILKTRRFGYDGKGQALIRAGDDPVAAWRAVGEVPAILEALVSYDCEISVIVARRADGQMSVFDVGENVHDDGILTTTTVPAGIPASLQEEAAMIGKRLADALHHVGVLSVEMFVTRGGQRLVVNEIAPRVHNSGHWTMDACLCSQFEQHLRALSGWPLGDSRRHSDVVMANLLGDSADQWLEFARLPGLRLHLYGKSETRTGRKMGHVNRLSARGEQ